MNFAPIPEILEDIRLGRMVVIVDDEDRENEGDLIIAAEDEGLADAVEPAEVVADDELDPASARTSRTPRIHVPATDLDGEAPKPKPRSRAKPVPATVEEAPVEAVASDPESDGEVVVDGEQPVKKKTRRGSRGGRNRKKKPVVAGGNGDAPEAAEAAQLDEAAQPDELAQPAAVAGPHRHCLHV